MVKNGTGLHGAAQVEDDQLLSVSSLLVSTWRYQEQKLVFGMALVSRDWTVGTSLQEKDEQCSPGLYLEFLCPIVL